MEQFSSKSNLKKQFSLPSKLGRRKVCVFRGVILYIFGLLTRDCVSNGNDHVQIAISTLTAYSRAVSLPLYPTYLRPVCALHISSSFIRAQTSSSSSSCRKLRYLSAQLTHTAFSV